MLGISPKMDLVASLLCGTPLMGFGRSHWYKRKVPRKSTPMTASTVGDMYDRSKSMMLKSNPDVQENKSLVAQERV